MTEVQTFLRQDRYPPAAVDRNAARGTIATSTRFLVESVRSGPNYDMARLGPSVADF
jgi:hypothetical protein